MSTATNNLSFLPQDYLPQQKRKRATRLGMLLLGIVMLGVGTAFTVAERTLLKLKSDNQQITQQCDMASGQIEQFEQLRQRQQELSRRARLAASLVEQMPRSAVVAEVRKRMPVGVTLQNLDLMSTPIAPVVKPGAAAAKPDDNEPRLMDVRLKIGGLAQNDPQVAQFVESLAASGYFTDASLLISQQTKVQGDYVRRFEVEVRLASTLPVEAGTSSKMKADPASLSSVEGR